MDLKQIFDMVLRTFIRRGVNWGVNKGIAQVSRKMGGAKGPDLSHHARDASKRARKAAQITRRMGR